MRVSIDSRTIEPGDVFIPIKGPTYDGHDYILEAINKGATILDVNLQEHAKKYRKKLKSIVIAVTGSAGKTTVKDLLTTVLSSKYRVTKTQENENNEIGTPLTILRADHATEIIIVEMGMRAIGEIRDLTSIVRPTHVVITGIGLSHIEQLKTQRNIAKAKAEVFRPALKWEQKDKVAFLNYQMPYYDLVNQKAIKAGYQTIPFKGQDKLDQNINLCYTVGSHFGLSNDEIQEALKNYKASSHRLEKHQMSGITVFDDSYNANPDGVLYALQYIKRIPARRKILVLGDMLELGKHSKREHKKVADYALDNDISIIFTYGQESANIKTKQIQTYNFLNKKKLHSFLLAELKTGDIVLVKGSRAMKMNETVECIKKSHG
jgi:UDP-N-acetylmuramoyl-tripeptide--D-alanyl-D-alanine ligase